MFHPRALCLLSLIVSVPAAATQLSCTGTDPNWRAAIDGKTASFQLRDRAGDYKIELTTPALNDPDTTAYTFIGTTDTAILIVSRARCNTVDHTAQILTQERSEAILLTGCCRVLSE